MQSRRMSAVEVVTGRVGGLALSFVATMIWLPHYLGTSIPAPQAAIVTAVYFGLSLGWNYVVRRNFNRFE